MVRLHTSHLTSERTYQAVGGTPHRWDQDNTMLFSISPLQISRPVSIFELHRLHHELWDHGDMRPFPWLKPSRVRVGQTAVSERQVI